MDIHSLDYPSEKSNASNNSSGNQEQLNHNPLSQSNILDVCEDLEVMMRQRKKYSFVLNYGMGSSHIRADSKVYNILESLANNNFSHELNDSRRSENS